MLTQEDLKLLAQLVHTEVNSAITASEERVKAYTERTIGNAITASEERMKVYTEQAIGNAITASEERMKAHTERAIGNAITTSEERMKAHTERTIGNAITASEERMKNHMNAVIETQVVPQIKQIADGHLQISEQLQRIEQRLDSLEETVTAHEWYIVRKVSGES